MEIAGNSSNAGDPGAGGEWCWRFVRDGIFKHSLLDRSKILTRLEITMDKMYKSDVSLDTLTPCFLVGVDELLTIPLSSKKCITI
jgi:hypothetical protein